MNADVASLLRRKGLKFDQETETIYQSELVLKSHRYWQFVLVFGAVLVMLFAIWDVEFFPSASRQLLAIRIGIVSPCLLSALRLSFTPLPPSRTIQGGVAVLTWICGTGVTLMTVFAEKPLAYYVFFSGVMIAMIHLAALMIGWVFVLGGGLAIVSSYIAITTWVGMPAEILGMSLFFLVGSLSVALVSAFEVERFKRRDFLGRRANEALLEKLVVEKRTADLANAAKTTFLAAASHDLRQPVQAISNFVAVLSGNMKDPQAIYLLSRIEASLRSLDELFLELLDISRLDAGLIEPKIRDCAVQPIFDAVMRDYALPARNKGLQLRCVPCGLVLTTDPALLERIVRNLVDNAIRYTSRGKVLLGCRRRGAGAAIQVLDTGCGIPRDLHELIFSEFFQVGNPERSRAHGFGLGLSIVRRLCGLLGHPLTLDSTPGRGSRFEIAVTVSSAAASDIDHRQHAAPPHLDLAGVVVLLIDDECDVRESGTLLLENWGCQVLAAASGAEAVKCVQASERLPDIVIVDFRLRAEETGAGAIAMVHAECGVQVPGIVVTGDTSPLRIAEAMDSGMLLLHKPLASDRLRDAIGQCLKTGEPQMA